MKINFEEKYTFILPAHWASFIVYGDASNFDLYDDGEFELEYLKEALEEIRNNGFYFFDEVSEESFFKWKPDYSYNNLGCDCLEYTFYREFE